MIGRTSFLQRRLAGWDASPLGAFLARLVLTLFLFKAWDIRFVPSAFRMEDVEPEVLAIAQEKGIDLLSRAAWPSWQGHALRIIAFYLIVTLLWWGLARLRARLGRRYGVGISTLATLLIAWMVLSIPIHLGIAFLRHGNDFMPSSGVLGGAVWGGWFQSALYQWRGGYLAGRFVLMAGTLECLMLALQNHLNLMEARDGALRARLAPHFLFNALNTLHAQVEEDPAGAQATTERLGGLFRQVLEVTEQATVPLARELAFVEDYLGIERQRLGDRLRVEVDVSEAALTAQVPVLSLQVLVENAIKHGVEPKIGGGMVRIQARLEGRSLTVTVRDSGDGTRRSSNGSGRALVNLRERLARPKDLVLEPSADGFQASFAYPQA